MGIKHNLFIDRVYNNNGPLTDLQKPHLPLYVLYNLSILYKKNALKTYLL